MAASELVLKRKGIVPVKRKGKVLDPGHYPEFLRANKRSVAQDWAHYSFSGGRIELIRPGVHCDPANPIYEYYICSAYPSIIVNLPSMRRETKEEFEKKLEAWRAGGEQGTKPRRGWEVFEPQGADVDAGTIQDVRGRNEHAFHVSSAMAFQ